MAKPKSKLEAEILAELEAEFSIIESDFGELSSDGDDDLDSSELRQFEAALAGTAFEAEALESSADGELSLYQIADGMTPNGGEEGWLGDAWNKVKRPIINFAKRKAKKLIASLTSLVRRFAKYRKCIPAVQKAVAAYQAGSYGSAIKNAYAAFRCIRSHS